MGKYGDAAIRAVQLFHEKQMKSPRDAWEKVTIELFGEGTSSQIKGCPRDAFLGLCGAGLINGIPSGSYTDSVKNKAYAIEAVELLKTNPDMEQSMLWNAATHGSGIQHNGQMDVVLALREKHLLT